MAKIAYLLVFWKNQEQKVLEQRFGMLTSELTRLRDTMVEQGCRVWQFILFSSYSGNLLYQG